MGFFFLICGVIVGAALSVGLLARHCLGITLRWRTLFFCAAWAIVLAAVLPRLLLAWAGLAGTVFLLGLCAAGAALAAARLEIRCAAAPSQQNMLAPSSVAPVAADGGGQQAPEEEVPLPGPPQPEAPPAAAGETPAAESPRPETALAGEAFAVPTFATVDDCLGKAWQYRESGAWQKARQILLAGEAQFATDEDLPFLLLQQAALLKRYGRWLEAVAVLQRAAALPQVRQQAAWVREVQQMTAFLQILHRLLQEQGLASCAPEAIPAPLMEQAEAAYKRWRSLS